MAATTVLKTIEDKPVEVTKLHGGMSSKILSIIEDEKESVYESLGEQSS